MLLLGTRWDKTRRGVGGEKKNRRERKVMLMTEHSGNKYMSKHCEEDKMTYGMSAACQTI